MKLGTNRSLRKLAKDFSNHTIDAASLAETASRLLKTRKLPSNLLNFLGRIHLIETLEQLCSEHPKAEFVSSVNSPPYIFDFDSVNGISVRDSSNRTCASYAALTYVEGLLVPWEICLASRSNKRLEEIPQRIYETIAMPRIYHQLNPLSFTGGLGYVVVIFSHQAGRPVIRQSGFCRHKGEVVPFNQDYGTFCSTMAAELAPYGIKLNDIRDMDSGVFRVG